MVIFDTNNQRDYQNKRKDGKQYDAYHSDNANYERVHEHIIACVGIL